MRFHESLPYRILEVFSGLVLLSVLWIIACLPVVTFYPATAALFGVVGEWVRGDERGVVRRYLTLLKRDFLQSLGIGILWTLLGVIVSVGALEIRHMTPVLAVVSALALSLVGIAYLATTIFLFPVMATFDLRWKRVVTSSFQLGVSFPLITIFCLVAVVLAGVVVFLVPVSILVIAAATSYIISWCCHRAFEKIGLPSQDD